MPDINADEFAGYRPFIAWNGKEHGSCHIFWEDGEFYESGWYWAEALPGHVYDGDPNGPFNTSTEAMENANDWN